jgi:hypothetical protein
MHASRIRELSWKPQIACVAVVEISRGQEVRHLFIAVCCEPLFAERVLGDGGLHIPFAPLLGLVSHTLFVVAL